jgi:hypothetical protein
VRSECRPSSSGRGLQVWPTTLRELEEALDVVARNPGTRSLKGASGGLGIISPFTGC